MFRYDESIYEHWVLENVCYTTMHINKTLTVIELKNMNILKL